MTKDDIIKLMEETGALTRTPFDEWCLHFAHLVAAAEREKCAKVCERIDDGTAYNLANECAAAIRARGTHD